VTPLDANANSLEVSRMKIGVVGCGYWGPNLVRNLVASERCEHVVCCDVDATRLEALKRRYPSVELRTDAGALMRDETVDGVMIATPLSLHYPLAKEALERGKHVFVEKPLTADVEEAAELVEVARRRGRTLMVGHTFLYSPPVRKIRDIITSGQLGDIYYISSTRVNLGLHQKDISVVWDLAPHDFSMIFYWLGETPTRVTATGKAFVQPDIPDVAFISMEFPSGAISSVNVSWLSPSKLRQTTIVGSKKMLVYDDTANVERVKIFDKGVDFKDPATFGEYHLSYRTGDIVSPKIDTTEPLATEVDEFLHSIRTGETPITDGVNGLRVVEVLAAASRAMETYGAEALAPEEAERIVALED
jgi:predicted dehydrogenase